MEDKWVGYKTPLVPGQGKDAFISFSDKQMQNVVLGILILITALLSTL